MSEEHGHIEVELEFPIQIETVLSVNFSIENFKLVFDFLLSTLRSHAGAISEHEKTLQETASASELVQTKDLLAKLQEQVNSLEETQNKEKIRVENNTQALNLQSEKIETTKQDLTEIQNRVQKLEQTTQELRTEVDLSKEAQARQDQEIRSNASAVAVNSSLLENHEARLEQLQNQLKAALEAIQKLGGDIEQAKKVEIPVIEKPTPAPVISKSYDSDIERLETQIRLLANLDLQNNLDNIQTRLSSLEQKNLEQSVQIQKQVQETRKVKEMAQKTRDEIQNKVNSDDFDRLQQYVYSLGQPSGAQVAPPPTISSKDLNLMRELANRLDTLQTSHNNLNSQVQEILGKLGQFSRKFTPEVLDSILDRLNTIQRILPTKADKSELEAMRSDIIRLRADLDSYSQIAKRPAGVVQVQQGDSGDSQKLNAISRRLLAIQQQLNGLILPQGVTLQSMANDINDLKQAFKELQNKISELQKDLLARIKALEQQIKLKASHDDLKALEENLQAKVVAVCEAMGKRFADKNDTKKALKYLEKLIKEYIHQPPLKADGSDAMFARKPLGGWSCASCAKALEKLMGKIGPYQAWNRLPYRDPSDRIARAGPGFSRMLATVQPELLTNRTKNSNFYGRSGSPQYEEDPGNTSEIVSLPPVMKQERPNTSYHPQQ